MPGLGTGSNYPPAPYTVSITADPPGIHKITAVASDNATPSHKAYSIPVYVTFTNSSTVIARGDVFHVFTDNPATNLNVLLNDATSTTNKLQIVQAGQVLNNNGTVRIGYGGTNLIYQPNPKLYGNDIFSYSVTDSVNTNSAYVNVLIHSKPFVEILSIDDGQKVAMPSNIPISGDSFDYDGTVTNISLYVTFANTTNLVGSTVNSAFTFNWSTNVPGFYTFYAVATDNDGFSTTSPTVTVGVYNTLNGASPVAVISNLSDTVTNIHGVQSVVHPVIRDGQFNLLGSAYDPDDSDDSYGVFLYRPDDPDHVFANVTPLPRNGQGYHLGGITNGSLGTLDLSIVPNGIYDLVLNARGGGDLATAEVRVSLDTQLKIGQFSFSEQDLVIPVNGIPLTVVRTYNSFNPVQGDFGFNWTYAINDMDVVIDEDRETVEALTTLDGSDDPLDSSDLTFSLRTGGGRNITLTLPDGRRTTFWQTFATTTSPNVCSACVDAQWVAAPGVYAKLTTPNPATWTSMGDNTLISLPPIPPIWQAAGQNTPMGGFDFPTFILTTQDGTKYQLDRDVPGQPAQSTYTYLDAAGDFGPAFQPYYIQPHSGKPRLTTITQRTGDKIVISANSVYHQDTNNNVTHTILFDRDSQNRITAIHDPVGTNGVPVVKYVYNQETGNLIQVIKLMDRVNGRALTNVYHYDNAAFPHYITSVDDARGIPIARNLYDDSGRLIGIVDASGRTNSFDHNITNRIETVYDRKGIATTYAYDTRGNVTNIVNVYGQTNSFAYDTNNFLLSQTDPLGNVTSYVNDTNGNVLSVTLPYPAGNNAVNYTTTFTYDPLGNQTSTTLPTGAVITNNFDSNTGNLLSVQAGTNIVTTLAYNANNLQRPNHQPCGQRRHQQLPVRRAGPRQLCRLRQRHHAQQ